MLISTQKTSKTSQNSSGHHEHGFSLVEIMVALVLVAMIFLAVPSGDGAAKHRALMATVDDMNRTMSFAANESVLRNAVVRMRILMNKNPIEYTVEYGPLGNLPLPDTTEDKKSGSLSEEKERQDKAATLDKQFTKVPEFEEIKRELDGEVTILGVATTSQGALITKDAANIYFYPTGEKDGALIFLTTLEELAFVELAPFLPDTKSVYEPVKNNGAAKVEDVLFTRMDEIFKEWMSR